MGCTLSLDQSSGLTIELTRSSCKAQNNTVRLKQPVDQILTSNACAEPVPMTWRVPGPFPTSTQIGFEVQSAKYDREPSLIVAGTHPKWTVTFEDGYDNDFDDLVFVVTADAAPK